MIRYLLGLTLLFNLAPQATAAPAAQIIEETAKTLTEDTVMYRWQSKVSGDKLLDEGVFSDKLHAYFMGMKLDPSYFAGGKGVYASENPHTSSRFVRGDDEGSLIEVRMAKGTKLIDLTDPQVVAKLAAKGINTQDVLFGEPQPNVAVKYNGPEKWWVLKGQEGVSFKYFDGSGLKTSYILNIYDKLDGAKPKLIYARAVLRKVFEAAQENLATLQTASVREILGGKNINALVKNSIGKAKTAAQLEQIKTQVSAVGANYAAMFDENGEFIATYRERMAAITPLAERLAKVKPRNIPDLLEQIGSRFSPQVSDQNFSRDIEALRAYHLQTDLRRTLVPVKELQRMAATLRGPRKAALEKLVQDTVLSDSSLLKMAAAASGTPLQKQALWSQLRTAAAQANYPNTHNAIDKRISANGEALVKHLLAIPLKDRIDQFEKNFDQLKDLEMVSRYLDVGTEGPLRYKSDQLLRNFSENLGKLPGKISTQKAIVKAMGDFPQVRPFVKHAVANAPSEAEGATLLRETFNNRSGALILVREIFEQHDISAAYFSSLLEAAGTPKSLGSDASAIIKLNADTLLRRGMTIVDVENLTPYLSQSRSAQREFLTKVAATSGWSAPDILRAIKTWGAFKPDDSDASDLSRGLANSVTQFLDKKPTAAQIGAYLGYIRPQSESTVRVMSEAINQPNLSPAEIVQILKNWGKVDHSESTVKQLSQVILNKGPAFLANFSGREILELSTYFEPQSERQVAFFSQAIQSPGAKVADIKALLNIWKGENDYENIRLAKMLQNNLPALINSGGSPDEVLSLAKFIAKQSDPLITFFEQAIIQPGAKASTLLKLFNVWGEVSNSTESARLRRMLAKHLPELIKSASTPEELIGIAKYFGKQTDELISFYKQAITEPGAKAVTLQKLLSGWGVVNGDTESGKLRKMLSANLPHLVNSADSPAELAGFSKYFYAKTNEMVDFFESAIQRPGIKAADLAKLLDTWGKYTGDDSPEARLRQMLRKNLPLLIKSAKSWEELTPLELYFGSHTPEKVALISEALTAFGKNGASAVGIVKWWGRAVEDGSYRALGQALTEKLPRVVTGPINSAELAKLAPYTDFQKNEAYKQWAAKKAAANPAPGGICGGFFGKLLGR